MKVAVERGGDMGKRRKWLALVAAVGVLALVSAACSNNDDNSGASGGTSGATGGDVTGSLNISGSSTVEPITSLNAEKFQSQNPDVQIAVDGPGTTDGFALFCKGETDISDASRVISDDEKAACASGGVDYIEVAIGQDALTVVGNPSNPVDCLTTGDLYALFGPESQGINNWADANDLAKKVGGKGDLPDLPLTIVAPGEESGTYGSFIDLVTKGIADTQGVTPDDALRPDYQISADDNVIIQNAEDTPGGLGFVGFSYAQEAGANVKEFQVDSGSGCVAPSAETVNDNTYPISRLLYVYVSKEALASNPAVKPFVDYYLSDQGVASVTDVKYIALPADQLAASRSTWSSESAA
jgi:phosphate transport system substrate-binding protein